MSDRRASTDPLLAAIVAYCRRTGMAESTFGRRVVNDGKFVSRLRSGGRITTQTEDRVQSFIGDAPDDDRSPGASDNASIRTRRAKPALRGARQATSADEPDTESRFRFYDNRQKYLLFVSTCTEKWVVAQRIEMELATLKPRPPALRMFDAGVGDGTILARVMRSMHDRFPTVPFYIVGKEISLEDVRLALEKMADRFHEHPSTVLVMTNMYYSESPWLRPNTLAAASGLVWRELALQGGTSGQFERQITDLQPFLAQNWTCLLYTSDAADE